MTNIQVGDHVTHEFSDVEYEVLGWDGDVAWCKDTSTGNRTSHHKGYLTKVPLKFEPGKIYKTSVNLRRYYCSGVTSDGLAYGYQWLAETVYETTGWISKERNQYLED